jgi:hypothetical protein
MAAPQSIETLALVISDGSENSSTPSNLLHPSLLRSDQAIISADGF